MAITLAQLKLFTKQTCDLEESEFGDESLAYYVNSAYQRLYDLLLATNEQYILNSFDFNLSNAADGYALPSSLNILKINGLDFNPGTSYAQKVDTFQWAERTGYNTNSAPYYYPYGDPGRYCLMGNVLHFRPITVAGGHYRCHYIPRLPLLVEEDDTILPELESWFNYIVVAASIKLLNQEKTDTAVLQTELNRLEETIRQFMVNRDEDSPKRVSNLRFRSNGFWRGY